METMAWQGPALSHQNAVIMNKVNILGHRRNNPNTVKPLLSRHLRDLPKCPLNRGCEHCTMFCNDQHSMVTLYCDKVECCWTSYPVNIQSSSSLPFTTNYNLVVTAKTLTDFSPYFKDVIQYYYRQFSPVSAWKRFLTIEISPIHLILVSVSA